MTYLELVNQVLMRLRERPITTVLSQSDNVVNITKTLVNDAKRYVENCHNWMALERRWQIEIEKPDPGFLPIDGIDGGGVAPANERLVFIPKSYPIWDTLDGCVINGVYDSKGTYLDQVPMVQIARWEAQSGLKTGHANSYALVKSENSTPDQRAGIDIRFYPYAHADKNQLVSVHGYYRTADLKEDEDRLVIPSQPVLYYALALAARERGEVGGQTATELFGMANNYISDAIAIDANTTPFDKTWSVV